MRQALHIFKKDARQLRLEIALALTVMAVFTFIAARRGFWLEDPDVNRGVGWMMAQVLLPLAWWILIARVVHAEAVPGDRQFWITRPYAWKSLLGAKLLFIAAFVNLPLFVADAIIIRVYGFSPAAEIAGLLWTQILFSAAFLLPVAALCAVTTGFVQLLSGTFILFVVVLAWNTAVPALTIGGTWGALDWITVYSAILVALLAASIILIWQYAKRETWAGRSIAGAAAIAMLAGGALIPWTSAFAIQSRLSKGRVDGASMHVAFDSDRKWLARAGVEGNDGRVEIELPLRIIGMPADMEAKALGLVLAIESPDGAVWHAPGRPWMQVSSERELLSLRANVDGAVYRRVKDRPVKLRGTLYFALYGNRRTTRIPFGSRSVPAPGLGLCSASRSTHGGKQGDSYFLLCSSAFRSQADLISVHFVGLGKNGFRQVSPYEVRRRFSYSPFPADLDLSPVSQYITFTTSPGELSDAVIDSLEPLAHVRRDFELDGLRLGEFEVHPTASPR